MGIDVTISSAQFHPHCSWKCKFFIPPGRARSFVTVCLSLRLPLMVSCKYWLDLWASKKPQTETSLFTLTERKCWLDLWTSKKPHTETSFLRSQNVSVGWICELERNLTLKHLFYAHRTKVLVRSVNFKETSHWDIFFTLRLTERKCWLDLWASKKPHT